MSFEDEHGLGDKVSEKSHAIKRAKMGGIQKAKRALNRKRRAKQQ